MILAVEACLGHEYMCTGVISSMFRQCVLSKSAKPFCPEVQVQIAENWWKC